MSIENKGGNEGKQADTSAANGGNGSVTPADESVRKIADLEARLAKETKDKETYRAGMLAMKQTNKPKIKQEDLTDPDKLDSAIEAKIQDRELEQKTLQEAAEKSVNEERLKAENEELRRSLEAAKTAGYSSAGTGSGHNENSESKPNTYWSEGQRNELRQIYASRNIYTSEQVERMVTKAEQIAQSKTATSERKNDLTKTRSY